MNKDKLRKLVDDISSVRVIVAGDFCLDAYWFINDKMSEISIETGEPTRPVNIQRYSLGGAGNVTSNLAALGIRDIRAFGVIGPDPFGSEMVRIMNATGINTSGLLIQEKNWSTHTYSKPYLGGKELSRIDFGNFNILERDTTEKFLTRLVSEIPGSDIVIINQQVPSGIHTEFFRESLLKVIRMFPGKLFITDSRNFSDFYDGTLRKMNDTEASRLCGDVRKPDEPVPLTSLVKYAETLFRRFGKPLFITRGSRGSLIIDSEGCSEVPGLMITSRVDTVGAGDSYLAGAAAALGAGYDLNTAAILGSFVAGVTVQKLFQTGTASPAEVIAIGSDADYVYSPDLADNPRQRKIIGETDIEVINNRAGKAAVRHVILDHDGTISTLREGWEQIMAPMMVRAILSDRYDDAEETLIAKVRARVDEYIDMTTGVQTLVQMKGLAALVREFGFVKEPEILDEHGYKHVYNEELLKLVRLREEKFRKGELALEDLTLKGAVPFIRKLYENGITLYLASGTDTEDVIREAELLGYASLFEGRIFGAVGDINREAKKIVLDKILDSIKDSDPEEIVTFGDGPVEIRETRKRNGITVGVASNELRRYGLNERKRTRLIKAGADYIVPDFSSFHHLLKLLNI